MKLKWVSVVRAESEAADARAKKESEESSKQKAAANAANAANKRPLVPQTAEEAAKRRKVEPTGPAAGASTPSQGSKETSTGGINKAPAAKVPTATKVGVPKPTTTIARTVTTIARPTTSSVTSFGGVNVRGVAAYRKDPTAGKLSSARIGFQDFFGRRRERAQIPGTRKEEGVLHQIELRQEEVIQAPEAPECWETRPGWDWVESGRRARGG